MKIIAILSQKGGVGKTTLATCIAVAAQADGKATCLLDLDPQATAAAWADRRQEVLGLEEPTVQSIQAVRLPHAIKAAERAGADLVVIDGAAVARDVAHAAASVADLVLIPTRPALFDTISMGHTLDLVRQLGKPARVILTQVAPRGAEAAETTEAVAAMGAQVCPIQIGNRKDYSRAQVDGQAAQEYAPNSAAAREIESIYKYVSMLMEGEH